MATAAIVMVALRFLKRQSSKTLVTLLHFIFVAGGIQMLIINL